MLEKVQSLFPQLPEEDQLILRAIYGQAEKELSAEAKRLKAIIDQLPEDQISLVFSVKSNDTIWTTWTKEGEEKVSD